MSLALTEVYEVATFYHHFEVGEGERARRADRAGVRLDRLRARRSRASGTEIRQ